MKNDGWNEEEKDLLAQLGERLSYLRQERDLTQTALAARAGVSKSYLCDCENGRRNPTLLVLCKIAKALDTTLEDIFQELESSESPIHYSNARK